jgi:tRNA (guanine37-N1)-methyltransferase
MHIVFITLFPAQMEAMATRSIFGRAVESGQIKLTFKDLRDYCESPKERVDDKPFGGTQGMLLRCEVIERAILSVDQYDKYRILYTCPKGKILSQEVASSLSQETGLIILSGYYEGIDERLFSLFEIERVSMGDVVVSSGDVPALAIAEATMRLLPGVVGNNESVADDSIVSGILEAPQYTQPRDYKGHTVPEVLTSGHHEKIRQWRREKGLELTLKWRPDLLAQTQLSSEDKKILTKLLETEGGENHE